MITNTTLEHFKIAVYSEYALITKTGRIKKQAMKGWKYYEKLRADMEDRKIGTIAQLKINKLRGLYAHEDPDYIFWTAIQVASNIQLYQRDTAQLIALKDGTVSDKYEADLYEDKPQRLLRHIARSAQGGGLRRRTFKTWKNR